MIIKTTMHSVEGYAYENLCRQTQRYRSEFSNDLETQQVSCIKHEQDR